jgi:hypothetical protein
LQDAFWTVHAVVDIIACLTIFILPVIIVLPLQMNSDLKAQVVFPFTLELPLCAFAIVRLIYTCGTYAADDHTWANTNAQIWTQICMHLGVVAASIPCLKMFLKGMSTLLSIHALWPSMEITSVSFLGSVR